MAITRRDLRRSVANMLSDFLLATDPVGGHTNQMTDLTGFARENDYFMGMQIHFCNPASPHNGLIANVTNSDGPTRTIFFEPPLPSDTIPGEQIEMYNFRSRGSTKQQYDRSITDAVEIARENRALVPTTIDAVDPFSYRSPFLTIPDELVAISGVQFTLRNGQPYGLPTKMYRVDRVTRSIAVRENYAYRFQGLGYGFLGYVELDLPTVDDDVIEVDSEWLFNEVKAQILERLVASGANIGSNDRLYLQERTEAGSKRPLVIARFPSNTIRLR